MGERQQSVREATTGRPDAGIAAADPLIRRWLEHDDGRSRREQALSELRAGAGARGRDLRGIRLIGENLSGLDLSAVDLSGADLSRADLRGARLLGANLRGTILHGATLTDALLLSACLAGADLSECSAERAGFGDADLEGATLFGADLRGVSFTKAGLHRADLRTARLDGARFREADLRNADLAHASLPDTDLERSDVAGASFVDTDLRRARFRKLTGSTRANWVGADVAGCDFCGAHLIRRTILDQNYLHEFRTESRLNAAAYWVWWATSDCGRSFLRWGLWVAFFAVVFAGLYETVEIDYGEHRTALSSLYYSVVTLTTLGYGDVLPASAGAQVLAMIQVTIGYVMLGGLLSIFSTKMSRRAD